MRFIGKKNLRRAIIAAALLALVPIFVVLLRPDLITLVSRPKRRLKPTLSSHRYRGVGRRRSHRGGLTVTTRPPTALMAVENMRMREDMDKMERERERFDIPSYDPDAPEDAPIQTTTRTERPRLSWLPESARPLFDATRSFGERLNSVHELEKNLSEDERNALYYFIASRPDDSETLVLKNDIMNALRDQKNHPREYADVMIALFNDHSLGETTRDYIIQHLRPWFEDNPDDRARILPVFRAALRETEGSIAGTSLLALDYLSRKFPMIDSSEVAAAAADMVRSTTDSNLSRISALQVAASLMNDPKADGSITPRVKSKVIDAVREIAFSDEAGSTTLRISAIAALGRLGTIDDARTMREIIRNGNRRYHPAARRALASLERRPNE